MYHHTVAVLALQLVRTPHSMLGLHERHGLQLQTQPPSLPATANGHMRQSPHGAGSSVGEDSTLHVGASQTCSSLDGGGGSIQDLHMIAHNEFASRPERLGIHVLM